MKHIFNTLIFLLFLLFSISYANSALSLKVNDKLIPCDVTPFIKNNSTYVPIRFVADALNVDSVIWNSNNKTVTVTNDNKKILFLANQKYAYINNEYTPIENNVLIVNNRTFIPIRFLAEALNFTVGWDDDTNTISISSSKKSNLSLPTLNNISTSNTSYNNDSVYWLSRIIEAEAGGEPYRGKVAVGEVILNRVESDEFPNTIWGVIFDNEFGIQFEPVANGSIYNTPSSESIKAAKEALSGSNYVGKCLYFLNPTIASSNWIVRNREFYKTIANHDFYA